MINKLAPIALSLAGIVTLTGACADSEEIIEEEFSGVESPMDIEPLATFDGAEGLRFASPDIAAQWQNEAPGVFRRRDGEQRLIIGADGHRWAVARAADALEALRADGADEAVVAAKEADLAKRRDALAQAAGAIDPQASCDISLYTGASSPITGYVGGAALAQLVCSGGVVVFTVQSQVCTGTQGCGPFLTQTAVVGSTPGLWGQARAGFGSCYSYVSVTPPGIGQESYYTCN